MWRVLILTLWPGMAAAESLVATRNLPARTIIDAGDLALSEAEFPGALTDVQEAIGLETRLAIYAGRPVRAGDVGPPALVERNALVTLIYNSGGLAIRAEGRALDRAAAGEAVRVMNSESKTTVSGIVHPDGTIRVGGLP